MRTRCLFIPTLLGLLLTSACQIPHQPSVDIRHDGGKAVTLNLDTRDYISITDKLVQSWSLSDSLKKGAVIAFGPVKINMDGQYRFDSEKLQDKLGMRMQRSGQFKFSYAVGGTSSAANERLKIMQLQFEQENTVDPEDLATFGQLAKVDYILFGRISSITARTMGKREVTYTFNWKLGNCKNGLIEWIDEVEISKSN